MRLVGIAWMGLAAVGLTGTPERTRAQQDTDVEVLQEAELTISVVGVERDEGFVRIAVFNGAEAFTDNPVMAAVVTPREGLAEWSARVPYGTYAVAVVHDRDGNGKLNTNLLGMPRERYGFSNDARGTFGPPSFDDASFSVDEPTVDVSVRVR